MELKVRDANHAPQYTRDKIQFSRLADADTWMDLAFATPNPVCVTIPSRRR